MVVEWKFLYVFFLVLIFCLVVFSEDLDDDFIVYEFLS